MKITLFLLAVFFVFSLFGQYPDKASRKEYMSKLVKEHCSDAGFILQFDPEWDMLYFRKDNDADSTLNDLIEDLNVVVHEACHNAHNKILKPAYFSYIISKDIHIDGNYQTNKPVYDSYELNNFVPDSMKKNISRFNTYLGRENTTGIYNLMNEYVAYYQGCQAEVELKRKGITMSSSSIKRDVVNAYYDFRLFISWYLQYAEQKHPEIYQQILENKNLRVAFSLIDQRFTELNSEVQASKSLMMGYSFYSKPYIRPIDLETLDKFRIKGVTMENYTSFLPKQDKDGRMR